jgi:hypothetical protein
MRRGVGFAGGGRAAVAHYGLNMETVGTLGQEVEDVYANQKRDN